MHETTPVCTIPSIHRQAITLWPGWLEESDWDSFATLTYATDRTVAGARRSIDAWTTRCGINRVFWVTERGERFGRVHHHALIRWGFARSFESRSLDEWENTRGFVRAEDYDAKLGAGHYLTKYVKKACYDYDFYTGRKGELWPV
jgi:hypothetical protein